MKWCVLILAITSCTDVDRGHCLKTERVAQQVIMIPRRVGNVTTITPLIIPARDRCTRWQFPNGKPPRSPR